jgi:hypothetical protein
MKKVFAVYLGILVILGLSPSIFAAPAEIVIIRHGEKPESGNELNERGRKRALELIDFFRKDQRVLQFGTPVAIYAAKPSSSSGSVRSIQTVTPTANELGLPVIHTYTKKKVKSLIHEIMKTKAYDGKTVLICWQHDAILDIIREMGVATPPAPAKWPGRIYDWAIIIDLDRRGKVISFQNIRQNLPMDSQSTGARPRSIEE